MKHTEFTPITLLDHSGDLMFQTQGRDFLEALANASAGMVEQIVPLTSIEEREEQPISAQGEDEVAQVAAFLNELLFLIDARKWLPKRLRTLTRCTKKGCRTLEGVLIGEPFDPSRHHLKYDIKAVTYHELAVSEKGGITTIQFVCDL